MSSEVISLTIKHLFVRMEGKKYDDFVPVA